MGSANRDHYGYIKGTVGKDKNHIDIFIPEGFEPGNTDMVAVVDQIIKGGRFVRHKSDGVLPTSIP